MDSLMVLLALTFGGLAAIMAHNKVEGWGWFLFIAFLIVGFYHW